MQSLTIASRFACCLGAIASVACSDAHPAAPITTGPTSCPGMIVGPKPAALTLPASSPATMQVLGNGPDPQRFEAEIAVQGSIAYTSTWNVRFVQGNKINIWDVTGNAPTPLDSVIVAGAITTGDVQISDDGKLMIVATEFSPGSIAVYDLTDPRHPAIQSRFSNDQMTPGVHTAKLGRVNGTLYAFLGIDPATSFPARLVILDLTNPKAPQQVYVKLTGNPYIHDTFERDGLLFVALWNDGLDIWDVGGCGTGATIANPRVLGNVRTLGGQVHNVWWYHDPSGSNRFAFVGEEGPGAIGSTSRGDIHVVDVTDPTQPKEVAFYTVAGAGTHNFSVDEANGVLYAAYYNGGVRAVDVRGDLGTCPSNQQDFNASANLYRCNLRLMGRELAIGLAGLNSSIYVWGVKYLPGFVYASDMTNGIWKLAAAK